MSKFSWIVVFALSIASFGALNLIFHQASDLSEECQSLLFYRPVPNNCGCKYNETRMRAIQDKCKTFCQNRSEVSNSTSKEKLVCCESKCRFDKTGYFSNGKINKTAYAKSMNALNDSRVYRYIDKCSEEGINLA